MCDSTGYVQSKKERHAMSNAGFIHRVRPAMKMALPFPQSITADELRKAFPLIREEFQKLIVAMFTRDDGCHDDRWEDIQSEPGQWYGLSWGCIHYHTLGLWTDAAQEVRWCRRIWRVQKIFAFLRMAHEPPRWNEEDMALCHLAFWNPLPIFAFQEAVGQLIAEGFLTHIIERSDAKEVHMYYPTNALATRLKRAMKK